MKIALLGYGVVGASVFELCAHDGQTDIVSALCRHPEKVPQGKGVTDIAPLLADPQVDTVVEVLGGLHPAYELVTAALRAGKNVVTANKHLVCEYYTQLTALAAENGVALRCTAAVGGGIPWLVNLERAARCGAITQVGGILNGTTNYILDLMHTLPVSFTDALASAQKLGYAEADPSADIDGLDICRKLAISANVAFGSTVGEKEVLTQGIRSITDGDIAAFKAHGLTCKLLANSTLLPDGSISATVEPCLLGADALEAAVPANYNLATLHSAVLGRQSYFGQGAGGLPTASNVVQDLLDIRAGLRHFYTDSRTCRTVDNSAQLRRYYVRTAASDPWLADNTENTWTDGAVITRPVSPAQMHAAAHTMEKTDARTFFAALL